MSKRFCWPVRPAADEKAILKGNTWRFTVLTERLIRMEYDPSGQFEDRASQSVFYRDFPPAPFTHCIAEGVLTLETSALVLTYTVDAPFAADTLSIALKTPPATTWQFGQKSETLGGTACTLDGAEGEIPLEEGVCARCGYALLDDFRRMLLNEEGWVEPRRENTLDLYFFGYGRDHIGAVQAFYRLTGAPPLLPAYALGNWWSRYHAYTQQEYLDLMERFKREDLPFSVAVVDMDWHITEIPDADPLLRGYLGWTGYTWNQELFPDYKQFLKDLHGYGVKTALNLHPAAGIRRHEAMYAKMCQAMGKEADGSPVCFDILDPKFMENYFDIVHHPYEEDGVDFWWMDWQQGTDYWWIHAPNEGGKLQDPREVLDPLWMLNHLHILDIQRSGKRPMFFSRYAGPGSQRYPVGFSGDTYITWESLDFQPYFTATASNIGYGWWSHDIGGHMGGYRDEELTARWVQLGVFSPILRLHSSNNPYITKEPWAYGPAAERAMKAALRLRHRLLPYLYAMNYRAHRDLLPLVQPMYYTHPDREAAYEVKNQYWFGSELIVAPITQKADPACGRGKVRAWLPEGIWTDLFTGTVYEGGQKIDLYRDLSSIPVLCKAGAILPMGDGERMEITVCPGADNSFTLYEDAGDGLGYQQGQVATTAMTLSYTPQKAVFTVAAPQGDLAHAKTKDYTLCFKGYARPQEVLLDGKPVEFAYDPEAQAVTVAVGKAEAFSIQLTGEDLQAKNENRFEKMRRILRDSATGMAFKKNIDGIITDREKGVSRPRRFEEYLRRNASDPSEWNVIRAMMEYYK